MAGAQYDPDRNRSLRPLFTGMQRNWRRQVIHAVAMTLLAITWLDCLPANASGFVESLIQYSSFPLAYAPIAIMAFAAILLLLLIAALLRRWLRSRTRVEPPPAAPLPEATLKLAAGRAARPAHGLNVVATGRYLRTSAVSHAIFISPEGDDAAILSVRVAREVADTGRRVILVDLTVSGAAAGPMLDGIRHDGITDLLAARAQFTDIIHSDSYSDCDVISVGNTDPALAMRNADRLPIILRSLSSAYDLVVIECGPANAADALKLAGADSEILVSSVGRNPQEVDAMLDELQAAGFDGSLVVTLTAATSGDSGRPRSL